MRVALAGFSQGYYAVTYTRYLATLKKAEIVGVCDFGASEEYVRSCAFVSADRFSEELGVPLVHTLEELIALQPEAVLLCCETVCHTKNAKILLENGIGVFVSKPLCFSSKQSDELLPAVKENSVLLCGQPLRYESGIREAAERIRSGEIGTVYSVRIRLYHEAMIHQEWERDPERSGGPLGTYGVYLFDLAWMFSGVPVRRLYALSDNRATPQIRDADTVSILAAGDKVHFKLELFSAVDQKMPFIHMEAVGTRGMLETRYDNASSAVRLPEGVRMGEFRTSDMAKGEMDHFIACMEGAAKPECGIDRMRYVTRCIEAVRRSCTSGREEMIV